MANDFEIRKVVYDDSVSIIARTYYARVYDEAIREEIVAVLKEMVKAAVTENPEFRQKIKDAVDSAITSLTITTLADTVRQVVRETLVTDMREHEGVR